MYKNKIFTGVLAISTIISNLAFADGTHTDAKGTGNAKTTLETGITIEEIQSADFGRITRFGTVSNCAIYMKPNGDIDADSCNNVITNSVGTQPTFEVTGPAGTILNGRVYNPGDSKAGILTNSDGSAKIDVGFSAISGTIGNSGKYTQSPWVEIIFGDIPDGEYSTKNPGGKPVEMIIDY